MKHNGNDGFDDVLKNPAYIAMGSVVGILIVILFCFIVWNATHAGEDKLVIKDQATNTVEIPSMGESVEEEVVVIPTPEAVVEEEETIEQLIAEKSNDLGIVFKEVDDWITAKEVTNLRSEPSTEQGINSVVVKLNNGIAVRRIGIDEESGWSKVIYEDQIAYAATAYMMPAEPPVEETTE